MDHGRCTTHEFYGLTCALFEALRERAGDACELCGEPGGTTHRTRLRIDHGGGAGRRLPPHAIQVRGLLCEADNTRLGKADSRRTSTSYTDAQLAYLRNAFWAHPETWPTVHPTVAAVRAAVAESNRATDRLTVALEAAEAAGHDVAADVATLRYYS